MRYALVAIVIALVTFGQLIIKFEVNRIGPIPFSGAREILAYGIGALTNVYILAGLAAAGIAAMAWIAALSRYDLSSVYPLLSLNFILVPLLSVYYFNESMDVYKIVGTVVIVLGVLVFSAGASAA